MSAAKEQWPKWERVIPLLVLTRSVLGWTGTVTKDGRTAIDVHYCCETGFRLS